MDYRKFLSQKESLVLPYFGGTRVHDAKRGFRIAGEAEPGWWRFEIEGRRATPAERASPVDLGSLPAVRGHFACGWIIVDGRQLGRIALPPDDEPAALSKLTARRWHSGDLLFDTTDFEDDAELAARQALEDKRALGEVRGAAPSLRAAFGYALGMQIAGELRCPVSMRELTPHVIRIAQGGVDATREIIEALVEQRRREVETIRLRDTVGTVRVRSRAANPVERADDVLAQADARMLSCRRIQQGTMLDVTYEVDGERIMSIVEIDTFQVIDPGVCLAGAHGVLTLDAMPSVIREAIAEDHLNITRHG